MSVLCFVIRVFEAVLHKGDRIPGTARRRFRIADHRQKFVSLDIYEEVEEVSLNIGVCVCVLKFFRAHMLRSIQVSMGIELS